MLLKIFSIGLIVIFVNFTAALALAQMTVNILNVILILIEYLACILQAIVLVSLVAIYIDHAQNFYHH
jgi:F0F1-type ATP synthase membrane subunit a